MNHKVYGMLAAAPIDFPNEVELRVYPHDRETGLGLPGYYPYSEHRSWDWVQATAPIEPYAWTVLEQKLREGVCVPLGLLGEHSIDLPDGTEGPGSLREEPEIEG